MVDFGKLRDKKKKVKSVHPTEIFRRIPKPLGINDLYTSQAEVLKAWFDNRTNKDTVIKLHTGGGKTLVGLLIAQSTINELSEPVIYLTPTVQLMNQTLEKGRELGINVVPYEKGKQLSDDFINSNAIMVATYNALFNGKSKFGLRGSPRPQKVGAVILDDAHAAFSVVRDSFTLEIDSKKKNELYSELVGLFREAFKGIGKLGTYQDVIEGHEPNVLEVPYWSWNEKIDIVRELLNRYKESFPLVWPLLRDNLHFCHVLVSRKGISITPVLPLVSMFPTFHEASRRVYMSATIADDSDIVRVFDADSTMVENPLSSRSLAGISERMILIPDLMPFNFDPSSSTQDILKKVSELEMSSVVLVPSDKEAEKWSDIGIVAKGSAKVDELVAEMQSEETNGPAIFSNRYDGIDLPGNSCRLLVMSGLPIGTSSYELYKASALYGGLSITRMLAQRIEQGIGRGARGAGDYCVILMIGSDLAAWIAKKANFRYLTSATKAQLEMGEIVSNEVKGLDELLDTLKISYSRDSDWVEYHAETLAELVDEEKEVNSSMVLSIGERKAFNLWHDGHHDLAIAKLEKITHESDLDSQTHGWMKQLSAKIAEHWGNSSRAATFQREAYSYNRNLIRPKVLPPYKVLPLPGNQAEAIVSKIKDYRIRRGVLQAFERSVEFLNSSSSANQFEQALEDLGSMLGFISQRYDDDGVGPDLLWLLPGEIGLVIEAKSRKKGGSVLRKAEHGQLLEAAEWFSIHYPNFQCVRVSVHNNNRASRSATAQSSYALTLSKLQEIVNDCRSILTTLVDSQLEGENLLYECERLLNLTNIRGEKFVNNYLQLFVSEG